MKLRLLLLLTAFIPAFAEAHNIPVPHDHMGIISSWEILLVVVAIGMGALFLWRKTQIRNSGE